MKIKEVCTQTGLTERAVRYYIDRGLVSPNASEKRDRTYYEFTQEHVAQLRHISLLRRCGFSIDAILEMKAAPHHIPQLLRTQWEEVRAQSDALETRLKLMETLSKSPAISFSDLAAQIEREMKNRSLPDITQSPDFGRLDDSLPPEEIPPEQTDRYLSRQLTFYTHTRRNLVITGILLLLIAITGWFCYLRTQQMVNCHLFIASVSFSEKQMEDGKYYAVMTVYPNDFVNSSDSYQVPVQFSSWEMFTSTLSDTPYAAAALDISLRQREAERLGLYDPITKRMDPDAVLADPSLSREYTAVTYLQADIEYSN